MATQTQTQQEGAPLQRAASTELTEALTQMRETVEVKDRRSKLRTYKRCFMASEAVDWLVANRTECANRTEAVDLCRKMHRKGFFRHVINPDQVFQDKELFFRFAEHDEPSSTNGSQVQSVRVQPYGVTPAIMARRKCCHVFVTLRWLGRTGAGCCSVSAAL
eukprot:7984873-Pyramimonas_sp.AAC.1